MKTATVLVIGGGQFGARACRYFAGENARVILVDSDPECRARQFVRDGDFHVEDAKDAWRLALSMKPELTVPTHPGHTLGKWLCEWFNLAPYPDLLDRVVMRLPPSVVLRADETRAELVASFMNNGKMCAPDCMPSGDRCTVTGEPRPAPLYRLLDYAISGLFDCGRIVVAEQLAAGIGGIRTTEFLNFVAEIEDRKPETVAVGTACRCHGILSLFRARR